MPLREIMINGVNNVQPTLPFIQPRLALPFVRIYLQAVIVHNRLAYIGISVQQNTPGPNYMLDKLASASPQ